MTSSQENLAIVNGGPLDLEVKSMWQKFEEGYKIHPNGPAVISTHQSADHLSSVVGKEGPYNDDCLTLTYAEMRRGASRIAMALEADGVKRGSILMTLIPNGADWSLFFWVTAMLQLTLVPLDPTLLDPSRADSLRYFLELLKPSTVVIPSQDETQAFDNIYAQLPQTIVTKVICETSQQASFWTSISSLAISGTRPEGSIENDMKQDPALERNGARLATILFTSGTSSGNPKGCPLSVSNLAGCSAFQAWFLNMDSQTRVVQHTVNFRGIHFLSSMGAWGLGATVILAGDKFSPVTSLDAIERHGGTWMMCVPAMIPPLQSALKLAERNLSSLRLLALAGDIITKALADNTKSLFPHTKIINIFGMTEGIGSVGWDPMIDIFDAPTFSDAVPVGQPLPGITIKICDLQKRILPRNETGELHISGPNMISGYYAGEQPDLFYEEEGKKWIITGDRAMIDNSNFVFVLGRSKDVIKKSGIPLSPMLIEAYVGRTTGIQAQAFGIPNPIYGEEPFLVIKDSDPLVTEGVAQSVAAGLGPDYILKGVVSLGQLGFQDFPINPSGKIMKNTLKEAVIAYLANL